VTVKTADPAVMEAKAQKALTVCQAVTAVTVRMAYQSLMRTSTLTAV
jgi:hypothetical protein